MKNENNFTAPVSASTSAPLRVKTNVRAGVWYSFLCFGSNSPYPNNSGPNAVGGVRG